MKTKKKTNIKWVFNNHSTERFFERTALNITKKQISKAVFNNQIVSFKRINTSRSMAYIHVNTEIIKTVLHKKKNKIITILPWKSIYQYTIKLQVLKYENKIFKIHIFPDCYMETKKFNSLTKIYEYKGKSLYDDQEIWERIEWNHSLFKELFAVAWSFFKSTDEDHLIIQKKRKEGNETFEIKGKTKENESIIQFGIDYPESFSTGRTNNSRNTSKTIS